MEIDQASKSIDHAKFRQRTSTTASTTEIICIKQEKQDPQLRSNQFTPINHLDVITVSDNTDCDTEQFDYRLTATSWLTDSHIDLAIQSLTKFGNPEIQIQTCLRTMELSRWNMCLYHSFRPQIYIVFTGNHWYVLTNINVGCEKDIDTMEAYPESFANEWFIYDSLNDMMPQNLNAAGKILKMIDPDGAC